MSSLFFLVQIHSFRVITSIARFFSLKIPCMTILLTMKRGNNDETRVIRFSNRSYIRINIERF